jgi:hypothetical protein
MTKQACTVSRVGTGRSKEIGESIEVGFQSTESMATRRRRPKPSDDSKESNGNSSDIGVTSAMSRARFPLNASSE